MNEFFKSGCRLLIVSLCLLLGTSSLASPASASSFTVNDNDFTSANVTSHIEYYIDRSGRLSLDQIKTLPEDAWLVNTEDNLRFGFSTDVYWLRFELSNQTAHPLLLVRSQQSNL
jgi:hypothetical protein